MDLISERLLYIHSKINGPQRSKFPWEYVTHDNQREEDDDGWRRQRWWHRMQIDDVHPGVSKGRCHLLRPWSRRRYVPNGTDEHTWPGDVTSSHLVGLTTHRIYTKDTSLAQVTRCCIWSHTDRTRMIKQLYIALICLLVAASADNDVYILCVQFIL